MENINEPTTTFVVDKKIEWTYIYDEDGYLLNEVETHLIPEKEEEIEARSIYALNGVWVPHGEPFPEGDYVIASKDHIWAKGAFYCILPKKEETQ